MDFLCDEATIFKVSFGQTEYWELLGPSVDARATESRAFLRRETARKQMLYSLVSFAALVTKTNKKKIFKVGFVLAMSSVLTVSISKTILYILHT